MTRVYRLQRPERNWHALLLLAFTVATGLVGLLTKYPSTAVEAAFPGWLRYLWYGGLVVCGSGGIYGYARGLNSRLPVRATDEDLRRWLRHVVTAMSIERVSMLVLTGLCVSYVLGAVMVSGDRAAAALGVSYVSAFAAANIARARQLRIGLRRVNQRLSDATELDTGATR